MSPRSQRVARARPIRRSKPPTRELITGYTARLDSTGQWLVVRNKTQKIIRTISIRDILQIFVKGFLPVSRRRSHPRIDASLLIKYAEPKGPIRNGYTATVGGGGLFLESSSPVPVGTPLEFKIYLPYDRDNPIKATGEVVWVRQKAQRALLLPGMGVQFSDIDEEHRRRLLEFIRILSKASPGR